MLNTCPSFCLVETQCNPLCHLFRHRHSCRQSHVVNAYGTYFVSFGIGACRIIWSKRYAILHPALLVLVTVVACSGKFKFCSHSNGMPSSSPYPRIHIRQAKPTAINLSCCHPSNNRNFRTLLSHFVIRRQWFANCV